MNTDPTTARQPHRIAGAPISWGVCEVPGWGHQLQPERVLKEMREADVLVLSAVTGMDGYDSRPELDARGWKTLLSNLDRLAGLAAERGVRAVLHPHVGTMIENGEEVRRVLEDSSISLCLDTGHLLIGGTDPAELTRQAPERIAHTHLKDVDASLAAKVQSGRLTYTEAVRDACTGALTAPGPVCASPPPPSHEPRSARGSPAGPAPPWAPEFAEFRCRAERLFDPGQGSPTFDLPPGELGVGHRRPRRAGPRAAPDDGRRRAGGSTARGPALLVDGMGERPQVNPQAPPRTSQPMRQSGT